MRNCKGCVGTADTCGIRDRTDTANKNKRFKSSATLLCVDGRRVSDTSQNRGAYSFRFKGPSAGALLELSDPADEGTTIL